MALIDPFSGMAAFVKAAEAKSFTAAARALSITPSAVSKAVSRLEAELKVTLFNRSPRLVTLTSEGAVFYDHCRDLLSTAEDARAVVSGQSLSGAGLLRVCLPISFGQLVVASKLQKWQKENPDVSLEVVLTDRQVDLVQERFDLAIRFDSVPDSRLIAKQLTTPTFLTVAAPCYLKQRGIPNNPEALSEHDCLAYVDRQNNLPRPWLFQKNKKHSYFYPKGNLSCDQGSFLLNHAIAGGGIMQGPEYLLRQAVSEKKLSILFKEYESSGPKWWLVYPYSRQPSLKLKSFVAFLCGVAE